MSRKLASDDFEFPSKFNPNIGSLLSIVNMVYQHRIGFAPLLGYILIIGLVLVRNDDR